MVVSIQKTKNLHRARSKMSGVILEVAENLLRNRFRVNKKERLAETVKFDDVGKQNNDLSVRRIGGFARGLLACPHWPFQLKHFSAI